MNIDPTAALSKLDPEKMKGLKDMLGNIGGFLEMLEQPMQALGTEMNVQPGEMISFNMYFQRQPGAEKSSLMILPIVSRELEVMVDDSIQLLPVVVREADAPINVGDFAEMAGKWIEMAGAFAGSKGA